MPSVDTATTVQAAADGRPFRTPPPNPPCPGGKWPGDIPKAQAMATGLAVEITRENLDTEEKRRLAVRMIFDSGYLGTVPSGHIAQKIVSTAWDELQGVSLPYETQKWLDEQREGIAQFNQRIGDNEAAVIAAEKNRLLRERRKNVAAALANSHEALAAADTLIANQVEGFEDQLSSLTGIEGILRFGSKLAGARETVAILRKKIVPSLEKQLTELDLQLALAS